MSVHNSPATAWADPKRLIDDHAPDIARWYHDPEARLILRDMANRPPREERSRDCDGEIVRFMGERAARLEAIRGRYTDRALGAGDHAAFCAQRPVAWLILDAIDGLSTALAPVEQVSATRVAA